MKSFSRTLAIFILFICTVTSVFAQLYGPEGLNMPGSYDGFTNPPTINAFAGIQKTGGTFLLDTTLAMKRYKTVIHALVTGGDVVGGTYTFDFTSGSTSNYWGNKWNSTTVSPNSVQSYAWHNDGGGTDNSVTFTNGFYYTVNYQDNNYASTNAAFLVTSAVPVTISSVSQQPSVSSVYANIPVVVSVTLSAVKCAEESVYVRYTTDSWATSTNVPATFSATTVYKATLPAQAQGTTLSYYVYTTTVTNPTTNQDLLTLNSSTNNKANYSYTVGSSLVFYEPFNYTAHATNGLYTQSGGAWRLLNTGDSVLIESGNAGYPGLKTESGNRITFGGTGSDNLRSFSPVASGTIYYSFTSKVTDVSAFTTNGYVTGFYSSTNAYFAHAVWKKVGTNQYNIGLNANTSTTAQYAAPNFNLNDSVFVVIAYTMIPGANNDSVKMWVNPTTLGGSIPSPTLAMTTSAGTDPAALDRVFIRQDAAGTTPTVMKLDEMRVGTTWATVTPGINVSGGPLSFGNIGIGQNSTEQTFTVSGNLLTANLVVTAPTGFQVSTISGSGFSSSVSFTPDGNGNVATSTVYARFSPSSAQVYSGNIVTSSTGMNSLNVAVSGTGMAPSIIATGGPLSFANTQVGNTSSEQSYTLSGSYLTANLVVTAPTGFEISQSSGSGFGSSVSLSPTNGTVSAPIYVVFKPLAVQAYSDSVSNTSTGATSKYVTVSGTGLSAGTPTITVTGTLTNYGLVLVNNASTEQQYQVSGQNLSGNITITAPTGFQVSLTSGSGFGSSVSLTQTGGSVPLTWIYARFNPATTGAFSSVITHTSSGALQQDQSVAGTSIKAEPTAQSTSLSFGTVTSSTIDLSWTRGNGDSVIVVAKQGSTVNSNPADGNVYSASAAFGSGSQLGTGNYVVYNGTGTSVTVTGLATLSTYYFSVYEFNSNAVNSENYLVTSPATGNQATIAATYTWSGGATGVWGTSTNWTPVRTTPAPSDVIQFNSGGTIVVTGITAQSIGQLKVSGGTYVTLQAGAASTLSITGGAGTDLTVGAGDSLNINTSAGLIISLATGTTGSISGSMTVSGGAHQLLSVDASSVTFQSGSSFTEGTSFTGNPFGTTNLRSIVFANGSTFIYYSGSNLFGATAPSTVVVLQTGSTYRQKTTSAPSLANRRFANFEYDNDNSIANLSTSSPDTMDNVIVTNGTLGLSMKANWIVYGNITVNDTLNLNASTAGTMFLVGSTPQTIGGNGALTLSSFQAVTLNNANGLTLQKSVSIPGALTFSNGNITTGSNTLTLLGTVSRTSGYVIGNLLKNYSASGSKLFEVGTANGYSPVTVDAIGTGNFTVKANEGAPASPITTNALNRYWTLTNGGLTSANLTFNYLDGDVVGTETNYKVWRNDASGWTNVGGSIDANNNSATINGVTSFSDWTLSECPVISLNPTSLSNGVTGTAYNSTVTAGGGKTPYSFAKSSGSLPAGLLLASTGLISGTPTGLGTFNFDITATDSNGCTGTRSYSIQTV